MLLMWITNLFLLTALVVSTAAALAYLYSCYVMYRVGEKFRIGKGYCAFLIPVYNLTLLCGCAGITRWTAFVCAFVFPATLPLSLILPPDTVLCAASVAFAASWGYLWGSIAEKLSKNFYVWFFLSIVFLGFPILLLAFDGSMPRQRC